MKQIFVILVAFFLFVAAALPTLAHEKQDTDTIALPIGFRPEGIARGRGSTLYAGSLADGTVLKVDVKTGKIETLVAGEAGRIAVGMNFDRRNGNLFVAGGPNGVGRVYDTKSGELLAEYPFGGGFVNDVIVTREAAYFTDSQAAVLYVVPLGRGGQLPAADQFNTLPLSGEWQQLQGFNANGIESRYGGKLLFVVNSSAATVYQVDPDSGEATAVDLGGESVPNGDGLLLRGRTLYVVQNRLNQIGVIKLDAKSTAGEVEEALTNPNFNIPTTAAFVGGSIYAVNAKFGIADPNNAEYEIVRVTDR